MGTEGTRARSHAHGKRHGRITVHLLVIALAVLAVTLAARYPTSSGASNQVQPPAFTFSGLSGDSEPLLATYFRPGASVATRDSVLSIAIRADARSVRATGGVSPTSSLSAGVSAAAAASGEQGAGVKPLADIVDPKQPYILYVVQPGDSISLIAQRHGVKLGTVLDNNPTIDDEEGLIQLGQEIIVPRKDGILYKVAAGDTVDSIVGQYDNIESATVIDYKPNNISDPKSLEQGRYLLLPGATHKPPPPPPPAPAPAPSGGGGGGGGGSPLPGGSGRFNFPLASWHGVSDPFGTNRGGGRIHEGIDLDLYGYGPVTVFSACSGVVSRVEYLTYSYGYHVIVDCGDGWTTLYAHMSQINVSPGQRVSGGSPLGLSGVTGYTTGHHLHFEIRTFGAPVNPAAYLPF